MVNKFLLLNAIALGKSIDNLDPKILDFLLCFAISAKLRCSRVQSKHADINRAHEFIEVGCVFLGGIVFRFLDICRLLRLHNQTKLLCRKLQDGLLWFGWQFLEMILHDLLLERVHIRQSLIHLVL